jgi:hypothetical protein
MALLGKLKDIFSNLGTKLQNTVSTTLSNVAKNNIKNYVKFPNEHHLIEIINGQPTLSTWTGPNTDVISRQKLITEGKLMPYISDLDKASMKHDLSYFNAKTPQDIWRADDIFTQETSNLKNSKYMGAIAGQLMQGKKLLERMNISNVNKWIHK